MTKPVKRAWFAVVRDSHRKIKILAGPFPSRKICLEAAPNIYHSEIEADHRDGPSQSVKERGWDVECCGAKRYSEVVDRELFAKEASPEGLLGLEA